PRRSLACILRSQVTAAPATAITSQTIAWNEEPRRSANTAATKARTATNTSERRGIRTKRSLPRASYAAHSTDGIAGERPVLVELNVVDADRDLRRSPIPVRWRQPRSEFRVPPPEPVRHFTVGPPACGVHL